MTLKIQCNQTYSFGSNVVGITNISVKREVPEKIMQSYSNLKENVLHPQKNLYFKKGYGKGYKEQKNGYTQNSIQKSFFETFANNKTFHFGG